MGCLFVERGTRVYAVITIDYHQSPIENHCHQLHRHPMCPPPPPGSSQAPHGPLWNGCACGSDVASFCCRKHCLLIDIFGILSVGSHMASMLDDRCASVSLVSAATLQLPTWIDSHFDQKILCVIKTFSVLYKLWCMNLNFTAQDQ